MAQREKIEFDEGWPLIESEIKRMIRVLEEKNELQKPPFLANEYMQLHHNVYRVAIRYVDSPAERVGPPDDERLYNKCNETFEEYITLTVLPCIMDKHDEFMLRELVKRWTTYQVMVRWFSHFFSYLDLYYTRRRLKPSLCESGMTWFKDLVYEEVKEKVRDVVMVMIEKEREGEVIDRVLVKSVVEFFIGMGMGKKCYEKESYEKDFEAFLVEKTGLYDSRKAADWVLYDI